MTYRTCWVFFGKIGKMLCLKKRRKRSQIIFVDILLHFYSTDLLVHFVIQIVIFKTAVNFTIYDLFFPYIYSWILLASRSSYSGLKSCIREWPGLKEDPYLERCSDSTGRRMKILVRTINTNFLLERKKNFLLDKSEVGIVLRFSYCN